MDDQQCCHKCSSLRARQEDLRLPVRARSAPEAARQDFWIGQGQSLAAVGLFMEIQEDINSVVRADDSLAPFGFGQVISLATCHSTQNLFD